MGGRTRLAHPLVDDGHDGCRCRIDVNGGHGRTTARGLGARVRHSESERTNQEGAHGQNVVLHRRKCARAKVCPCLRVSSGTFPKGERIFHNLIILVFPPENTTNSKHLVSGIMPLAPTTRGRSRRLPEAGRRLAALQHRAPRPAVGGELRPVHEVEAEYVHRASPLHCAAK